MSPPCSSRTPHTAPSASYDTVPSHSDTIPYCRSSNPVRYGNVSGRRMREQRPRQTLEGLHMDAFVTYRGVVYPWHCDHLGHMNNMWFAGKFDEASWNLVL